MGLIERFLCWALPYQDIYEDDEHGRRVLYLRRWFLRGVDDSDLPLEQRTARVVIHKMYKSDSGRQPHDHSFGFLTRVLWGGYINATYEVMENWAGQRFRIGPNYENMHVGKSAYREATHIHQVLLKDENPCWTLVFMDKPSRNWGFVDEDGTWIGRKEYKRTGGDK